MVCKSQGGLTINELLSISFPEITGREILVLFKAYVDDSSDERQEVVMVAGSFIGLSKQWSKFKRDWKRVLKANNLRYFRSTEYYSLRGEFEQFRDRLKFPEPSGREKAKRARDDLHNVVERNGIAGLASCIPIPLYKELREADPKAQSLGRTVFEVSLRSLFRETCKSIRAEFEHSHQVAFICDDGPESRGIQESYLNFKERHPVESEMIVSLVTADDKKVLPLQAADLMASLAKETYCRWIQDPNLSSPSSLSGSVFSISTWTKKTFEDAIKYEASVSERW